MPAPAAKTTPSSRQSAQLSVTQTEATEGSWPSLLAARSLMNQIDGPRIEGDAELGEVSLDGTRSSFRAAARSKPLLDASSAK